jgi:hypothetical protein
VRPRLGSCGPMAVTVLQWHVPLPFCWAGGPGAAPSCGVPPFPCHSPCTTTHQPLPPGRGGGSTRLMSCSRSNVARIELAWTAGPLTPCCNMVCTNVAPSLSCVGQHCHHLGNAVAGREMKPCSLPYSPSCTMSDARFRVCECTAQWGVHPTGRLAPLSPIPAHAVPWRHNSLWHVRPPGAAAVISYGSRASMPTHMVSRAGLEGGGGSCAARDLASQKPQPTSFFYTGIFPQLRPFLLTVWSRVFCAFLSSRPVMLTHQLTALPLTLTRSVMAQGRPVACRLTGRAVAHSTALLQY